MDIAAPSTVPDPLLYRRELPRVRTLFPLGQAVEISTNSDAVEAAFDSLWCRYSRLFNDPAITLRVAVSDEDSETPQAGAVARGQGHLVCLVSAADNFAVADLRLGYGFVWLTRDVAASRCNLIWNFLEPIVYMMVAARHFAQVHAACVALGGRAVVLCGESGSGKTCLAYACARAGWQFVSGDAVQIVRSSAGCEVVGRPYSIRFRKSARGLFPELRSRPAVRSPHGKLDIEVDSGQLPIETSVSTRASHVVFLNRVSEAARPFLSTVPFVEAFEYLIRVVSYGDDALRSEQKRSLAELLDRPVLRLTYSGLDTAEHALRGLLE